MFFGTFCICVFLINLLLTVLSYQYNWDKFGLLLIIPRLIIFLIGLIWASHEQTFIRYFFNKRILIGFIILSILLGAFTLFLKNTIPYYIQRLTMLEIIPSIFVLPGLFIVFIQIYNFVPLFLKKVIEFMGLYSLELYLVHQDLYQYGIRLVHCFNINKVLICFSVLFASFSFAYVIKKVVNLLFYKNT